jgi:uncharacterized protein
MFIYLHGFASSPNSTKARDIKSFFASLDIDIKIPDLNNSDFSHLTITRQIQQVAQEFPNDGNSVTLIGSSLGGLTAVHLAENNLCVQRLVLLAPAFDFLSHWLPKLGEKKIERWQQDKYMMIYHYGKACELPLHYDFVTDAALYQQDKLRRQIPTLILHGVNDDVIPIQASQEFARSRPWVEMLELESDHALFNVINIINFHISRFCHLQ